MPKGNGKHDEAKKTTPLVAPLTAREIYVLAKAPTILASLVIRKDYHTGNQLADEAIKTAGHIWDVVSAEPRTSTEYLLENIPLVLSGMMMRRVSTQAHELIPLALSQVERIWDVTHELDVPAEAMTSMPVTLDQPPQ